VRNSSRAGSAPLSTSRAHPNNRVTTQKRTMSSDDESYVLPSTEATHAINDGTAPEASHTAAPAVAAAVATPPAAGKLPPLLEIFQDTEHYSASSPTVFENRECNAFGAPKTFPTTRRSCSFTYVVCLARESPFALL
jgi:hypothetical protein